MIDAQSGCYAAMRAIFSLITEESSIKFKSFVFIKAIEVEEEYQRRDLALVWAHK